MTTYATTQAILGCDTVPSGWKVFRNKALLTLTAETVGKKSSDYTLLSLTKKGVIVRDLTEMKGKFPASFDTYQVVRPGNLVFCLFDVDETPRTVGLVRNVGMLTGAYTNFEVNTERVLPEFLCAYYLQVDDAKKLRPYYTGLRKVVKLDTFLGLRVAIPPKEEQAAIMKHLDEKSEKIDKLIEVKECEVGLLKEMKQGMIGEAVTRGLRGGALRASSIPWLPQVPEGWEEKKVRQVAKESKVKNKGNVEDNVLSLSYGKIIRKTEKYAGLVPTDFATYQIVESGMTVLRLTDLQNDHKSLRCGLVRERGIITSAYVSLIPKGISPEYLHLILHTYDLHKVFYSLGDGLRQSMNFKDVGNLVIPVPPLSEQEEIVEYLDKKCGELDKAVEALEKQVECLKELKQSMIADFVTGKRRIQL